MQGMEATGPSFVETREAVSQAGEERKTYSAMAVSKTDPVCSNCGTPLPADRVLSKCQPCHAKAVKAWRKGMTLLPTKKFPGVDIDAIHYKLGAVKK